MDEKNLLDFFGNTENTKASKVFFLPKKITKINVPPIKCQGIKTKLLDFIASNIKWKGKGTWYESFMGSGVVTFNILPKKAILSDINPHLINFYQALKEKEITTVKVKKFLEFHGKKLSSTPTDKNSYYYEMRDQFNENKDSLHFLFLNRSCFNGMIRFNSKGEFNTPFGKKSNRFSKAYITKIVNQLKWVQTVINRRDYKFICSSWDEVLHDSRESDFAYIDPPYYGRTTTYYNEWNERDALNLVKWTQETRCGYALSLWHSNRYRTNDFIEKNLNNNTIRLHSHFYFLGADEKKRNRMIEALIINTENATSEAPVLNQEYKNYKDNNSSNRLNKKYIRK